MKAIGKEGPMTDYTLFVVDDEISIREGITAFFEDDYHLFTYMAAEDALENLKVHDPDLVLLDIGLPGMNGVQALKAFKAINPNLLVIMITAYEEINSVIQCMKQGAYDYIVKPLQMEGLEVAIANALETIRLRKEIKTLQENLVRKNIPCFVGESQIIHDIMDYIEKVAKSPDTPILILGETGTGKELIANTIHYRSPNYSGPFITVNCAAIPPNLIESELFGYEKGAFSGASVSGKKGLIEIADKGTLFLDEVGDLNLDAQAKLLRFIEDGEFYKVGGTEKKKVTTRIVSATNKNLEKMIQNGTYRSDLFYRISVIKIQVPSLNERDEDVLLFAKYFLQMFNGKFDRSLTGLSAQSQELLKNHTWKGNVREMRNMIERAVLTAKGPELTPEDLGLDGFVAREKAKNNPPLALEPLSPEGVDLNAMKTYIDEFYFSQAMTIAKGNETSAAKLLKLKHHAFRYQYKKIIEQKTSEDQDATYD